MQLSNTIGEYHCGSTGTSPFQSDTIISEYKAITDLVETLTDTPTSILIKIAKAVDNDNIIELITVLEKMIALKQIGTI